MASVVLAFFLKGDRMTWCRLKGQRETQVSSTVVFFFFFLETSVAALDLVPLESGRQFHLWFSCSLFRCWDRLGCSYVV